MNEGRAQSDWSGVDHHDPRIWGDSIEFPAPGDDWGTVTEVGIFTRRPWWQRMLGYIYRPWRREKIMANGSLVEGGLDVPLVVGDGDRMRTTITFRP